MCPLADPADSFVLVPPAWETDSPPPLPVGFWLESAGPWVPKAP